MTYDILATGSSGNAVVINSEILIDCGVPYKTLEKSGYIKDLRLVLLTHQHSDHFNPSTVGRLHRERPALRWGCCEWMVPPLLEAKVGSSVIDVYDCSTLYFDFVIKPFRLIHDVPNCGYGICFLQESSAVETVFYATDTSTLDHIEAKNYDYYGSADKNKESS